MKFCLIGDNPAALPFLQLFASQATERLAACHVTGALANAVSQNQWPIRLASTAEDAFLSPGVDVCLLALQDPDDMLRLCRSVSQAEKHVLVIPPPNCVPAFSFELHLILDEARGAILPITGRSGLAELPANQCQLNLDPTRTAQLALEIPLAATGKDDLRDAVCRGLDLLAASGFRYAQVTALESHAPDGTFLSRLITLNSQPTAEQPLPPGTLMLRRALPNSMTPASQKSNLVLRQTLVDGSQRELAVASLSDVSELQSTAFFERVAAAMATKDLSTRWMESFSSTLELAEAVDKSLRRRRTVDVHFDTGSERGVFKSQMTAMGCGVLTYMMFGMVAYLIIAQLVTLPNWALQLGRLIWVAPLAVFLVAQLLLPLARERSSDKK